MMKEWSVKKKGTRYDVIRPDGTVKCTVTDGELAYEVANDMICDRHSESHPVRCIETGKEYKSHLAASKATGLDANCIRRCCLGQIRKSGGLTWEFADALEA